MTQGKFDVYYCRNGGLRDFLYYHILRARAIPTYRFYRFYNIIYYVNVLATLVLHG